MELQNIKEEKTISLQQYTTRVFLKMAGGLLVTFLTMVVIASVLKSNPRILYSVAVNYRMISIVTMFAQIGIVVTLTSKLFSFSKGTSNALFLVYAFSVGVTFSVFAITFLESVIFAFIAAEIGRAHV